jgi:hypothetical protein
MMRRWLLTALLVALPGQIWAQGNWQVGPHILVSIPRDDFENVSQVGGGFGVKVLYKTSDHLALRGDFAYLSYGKRFENLGFDPIIGPISAELQNQGFRLTAGPQLKVGGDAVAFYAAVEGGIYYFRTNVIIPLFYYTDFDSRDNNVALGWNGGVGFQFDIGLGPWIDIGVEYQTMYNLPGVPIDETGSGEDLLPGPDITAHELTLKFGVIFSLGQE